MCPDEDAILAIVYLHEKRMEFAMLIVDFVQMQFQKTASAITGLRACRVAPYGPRSDAWVLVEWREEPETEVMAVFKVEQPKIPCSCLMLFGVGVGWEVNGRPFRNASLEWTLARIGDLKELLPVLQHKLGIVHWPKYGGFGISIEGNPENCTKQQYLPILSSLYLHLHRSKE